MSCCSFKPASALQSAVTKNLPASPLPSAHTKLLDFAVKSPGISSYKKGGWGGGGVPQFRAVSSFAVDAHKSLGSYLAVVNARDSLAQFRYALLRQPPHAIMNEWEILS